jgi:hypothetical protein
MTSSSGRTEQKRRIQRITVLTRRRHSRADYDAGVGPSGNLLWRARPTRIPQHRSGSPIAAAVRVENMARNGDLRWNYGYRVGKTAAHLPGSPDPVGGNRVGVPKRLANDETKWDRSPLDAASVPFRPTTSHTGRSGGRRNSVSSPGRRRSGIPFRFASRSTSLCRVIRIVGPTGASRRYSDHYYLASFGRWYF